MRFVKMHGLGNDYVFLDGFRDPLPDDLPEFARQVSDRHFGIGGDGLIVFEPDPEEDADARMRIWNADGGEAEMCGNGLRCAAKALYDRGHARRERLRIRTGRGVLAVENLVANGRIEAVRVDMGPPILEPAAIPTTLAGRPPLEVPIDVAGREVAVTAVSMGNPHAVVFVEEPTDEWVLAVGPELERHPAFPERVNVEFVRIDGPGSMTMRVWERGSGETLACGTGACAAVVAAMLTGRIDGAATVHLRGGDLEIDWRGRAGVLMTGPAVEVFEGTFGDHSDARTDGGTTETRRSRR